MRVLHSAFSRFSASANQSSVAKMILVPSVAQLRLFSWVQPGASDPDTWSGLSAISRLSVQWSGSNRLSFTLFWFSSEFAPTKQTIFIKLTLVKARIQTDMEMKREPVSNKTTLSFHRKLNTRIYWCLTHKNFPSFDLRSPVSQVTIWFYGMRENISLPDQVTFNRNNKIYTFSICYLILFHFWK